MGQYVRAFCTAPSSPPLDAILERLAGRGVRLVPTDTDPHEVRSAEWEEVALADGSGRPPMLVTCGRDHRSGLNHVREELQGFIEFLRDVPASSERQRVLDHLRATKFIVACQLPEDDLAGAARAFLSYFEESCGGLVQADGEGFYDGDHLLLPV